MDNYELNDQVTKKPDIFFDKNITIISDGELWLGNRWFFFPDFGFAHIFVINRYAKTITLLSII